MPTWPIQSKCPQFYGSVDDISGQLVLVPVPWKLYFDGKLVPAIAIHKRCAASLSRILHAIWARLGKSQAEIDRVGMSKFSGAYNKRPIAGTSRWSMHAYGCAVDFDSANNWLGDHTPAMDRRVVEEFEREGWEWGGHWSRPDGMHFQAAWTRVNPPRLGKLTTVPAASTKQLAPVSRKVNVLQQVANWAKAISAAAGAIFTADNLGAFTGWLSAFSGLGKYVLIGGVIVLGYWLLSNVLLKMIKQDHEEGRYTPSGAEAPLQTEEVPDGVSEQPAG